MEILKPRALLLVIIIASVCVSTTTAFYNGGKFRNAEIKSIKRRSLCKELDCFSSSMQNELCKDIECPDVDECSDGSHKCHTNAKCFNAEGSYICRCNLGYEGDGFTCKLLA